VNLSRRIKIQLIAFSVIALVAAGFMAFSYVRLPEMLGIGRYDVTVELPTSGGLYPAANVTYRGTKVGTVESVDLGKGGKVDATLSLESGVDIPSNLVAEVHSQSAIGEQYVALLPRDGSGPPLKDGDRITAANVSVPPPIDTLLDAANRGLQAIPHDGLKTAIDESYTAIGGLGPELSRIVTGSTQLAIDARANMDSLTSIIDGSAPVLNSQADTADSIQGWAANLATVTEQLRDNDGSVRTVLTDGAETAAQAQQLVERIQPTLPVILANLVTVGQVAIDYQAGLEQLLVLVPQGVALIQGTSVANLNSKQDNAAGYLSFNLNFNLPPPCTTGYLPAQQKRPPSVTDAPLRPDGDLYCRVPQDSPFNVRGARNLPCLTVPGKRAPTVKMCESDEQYVPLNDGYAWKGDPNATTTGQSVPQSPPGESAPAQPDAAPPPAAPPPPVAVAQYDPATGTYVGPDGKIYTRADLASDAPKEKSWQDMLTPTMPN
jgi:phospholipid/cholesterol/gamma-HCH transport system substrate-binding protein